MAKRKTNPDWDKIMKDSSDKRQGKSPVAPKSANTAKINRILYRNELLVQRMTDEMEGKTKAKYNTFGARQFVRFNEPNVTIDGIKKACHRHYRRLDSSVKYLSCDVLATAFGPSCDDVEQIPDISLILVRFTSEKQVKSKQRGCSTIQSPSTSTKGAALRISPS